MSCIVCDCETRKYKCPKCFQFYCSLECSRKHKEEDCKPPANATPDEDEMSEPRLAMPFKTDDTVSTEQLEQLRHCEDLKNLLCNPHLRNFLKEVDKAPNAWKAMKVAMQEPLFVEFADVCLKVIEPPDGADEVENSYL